MDQHLVVFVHVAEQRNFSRAAEELHLTQPAVTQHIQALERDLGVKLFERTNKYVHLTKAGEVVYHHAKEIVGLHGRMKRLIDDLMHNETGTLAIGASYTYGEYILPRVIGEFRNRYPNIVPSISIANTRDVAEEVAAHHLDIGIVEGDIHRQGLSVTAISPDTMVVIVSSRHPLASRDVIDMSELEHETWILRESGSGTREMADKCLLYHGFIPKSLMEFGSNQVIKEAVEAGLGVSILSEVAVRKEILLDSLRAVHIRDFPIVRNFSLITVKSPFQTKAMSLFIEFMCGRDAAVE